MLASRATPLVVVTRFASARVPQQRLAAGSKRSGHASDAHLLFLLALAVDASFFGESL